MFLYKDNLMTDLTAFFNNTLADTDPEIAADISDEMMRQQDQIEMIASENIVSNAVLEAQGSVLTNKYAEGYSGRRYYGGCEHIDVVETLAIERAKKLFNCSFVNVQPHSCTGKSGCFLGAIAAGRYGSGDVFGSWWAFNPWGTPESVG